MKGIKWQRMAVGRWRPGCRSPVRGRAAVGERTKWRVRGLKGGEIAVIAHPALDELAARSLVRRRVRAVLNAEDSLSPRYPNPGPALLLKAGVAVVDCLGRGFLEAVRSGDRQEVRGGEVWCRGRLLARGRVLTPELVAEAHERAAAGLEVALADFLANTLGFAAREREFFARPMRLPDLGLSLVGRHAVVVARGPGYEDDLRAVQPYLAEVRPALIAVDGGADAIIGRGLRPDVIMGHMGSASVEALRCGARLVVHAYPDGGIPGLARVRRLGLDASTVPAPGTSEDLAILLTHELGAELIVAIGTHSSFHDFLEKGRPGMGSSLLVRLRVGPRLVDARGVSLLYRARPGAADFWRLLVAALVPLGAAVSLSPAARGIVSLWWMQLRLAVGW